MRSYAAAGRVRVRAVVLLAGVATLTAACTSGGSSGATSSATSASAPSNTAGAGSSASTSASATATPSKSTAPASTVPPPTPGNIHETVPSRVVITRPAVGVTKTASFGDKVTVQATSIKAITATAHGPGEIGGPAVEITLRFTNSTGRTIDLGNAVVTLLDSAKDPASTIAGSPADPVSGKLASGKSATGTYVFTVATNRRKPITINVSYAPSAPVVVLVGNAG